MVGKPSIKIMDNNPPFFRMPGVEGIITPGEFFNVENILPIPAATI